MTEDREAVRAWLGLLATSNALKKSVDAAFRSEFGLSISRFDVLAALDRGGPDGLRAGALSERLMVTEGNTTQVAAPLVREGLVARLPDEGDGRVVVYKLTRKGERLFAKMAELHRGWITAAFRGFSPQQLAALRWLLEQIDIGAEFSAQGEDAA